MIFAIYRAAVFAGLAWMQLLVGPKPEVVLPVVSWVKVPGLAGDSTTFHICYDECYFDVQVCKSSRESEGR